MEIILKVYIDNLLNLLYNKKRMLCKIFQFAMRLVSVFLAMMITIVSAIVPYGAEDKSEATVYVTMHAEANADNEQIKVYLSVEGCIDYCGFFLEFEYSPWAELISVSSSESEEGAVFSYIDLGSRVRILLDGDENLSEDHCLMVIAFDCSESMSEPFHFQTDSLLCTAYRWTEAADGLVPLRVSFQVPELSVIMSPAVTQETCGPELTQANGLLELRITGQCRTSCFAAGFEYFVVDLLSGETDGYSCIGVIGDEGQFVSEPLRLSKTGRFCVVVRPLSYYRLGCCKGEYRVFCIINGSLC